VQQRDRVPLLPIYLYDQSVLRRKAKTVHPEKVDREDIRGLADDMFESMRNANGIGLAANQVGSLHRIIVVDVSDVEEAKDIKPIALVNPVVIAEQGLWTIEEGCLSIPDVRAEVERAEHIRVRYKDLDFNDRELEATGLFGRVLLHEIDHLDGVLFIDYLLQADKKLLRGRLNKIRKGEVEVNYPVVGVVAPAEHHRAAVK
jgi:peptide deformylase